MTPTEFVERWSASGGAEMANSQTFLNELCDLLELPHPDPTQPDEENNNYVFEKAIEFNNGDGTVSLGRIDLYRRGCFVLESKQGAEKKDAQLQEVLATKTKKKKFKSGTAKRGTPAWEQAMVKARQQAKGYAEAIPGEWPPFLIVADVGHCFDLYADFTQSGKNYVPFPDPNSYRISLKELEVQETRELLKTIWLDPLSLDPSRRSARVTREVADRLAKLAKLMEGKHDPETVAQFLMRCLFTMFAEDVEIGGFQRDDFTNLLKDCRENLDSFVPMMQTLWADMDEGKFSGLLKRKIKQFNGGLFEDQTALPVNADQLELLIEAAEAEWNDVEPAIFGTLLERALDPVERHKLGAHYTPRAYVERLVMPTIIEPLREQWDTAYATAVALSEDGKDVEARKVVRQFHEQLCETRILDPACGSGNFLYVALELMKRLEGEVLKALKDFGEKQLPLLTVDPHQFLGIEVNPRAAAITDLVLWIGYLQWHFRARGNDPLNEPIIRKFHNIECRDAVLDWDAIEPVVDDDGNPVTRWDGRTTKTHPVTGEQVPDETARVQELKYINPRKAEWPEAEYIVGNPPFIGNWRMRDALGDGYANNIRKTYSNLPESCDYVMYWWHKAAEIVRLDKAQRFGLITTNSLRQTFNRRVVDLHLRTKEPISILFAIPDHPWVDSTDGAAVRISMTVGVQGQVPGTICKVISEGEESELGVAVEFGTFYGIVLPSISIGADVSGSGQLMSNQSMAFRGMSLIGSGFVITPEEAKALGMERKESLKRRLKRFRNGRDLTQVPRDVFVIDVNDLNDKQLLSEFPEIHQWLSQRVKVERQSKINSTSDTKEYARRWWTFGKPRESFRKAVNGLDRYIATPMTAKHRFFVFLTSDELPDQGLIAFTATDAFIHGVLSSNVHVTWTLSAGGRLGVGNDPRYNNSRCFETFPFPDPDEPTKQRIRELGEQLDAHRKRQQELHPDLTMTGMYNVLEKLRAGGELTAKEKKIHEQGLVSVLKQIHDDLDAAVFDAYGWSHDLSDEEILEKLVELNHERAEEEANGKIRWLRPEFQDPDYEKKAQAQFPLPSEGEGEGGTSKPKKTKKLTAAKIKKQPWPKTLPERITAVRSKLIEHGQPADVAALAKYFTRANKENLEELLETLVAVGQARLTDDGRFAA